MNLTIIVVAIIFAIGYFTSDYYQAKLTASVKISDNRLQEVRAQEATKQMNLLYQAAHPENKSL